MIKEKLIKIGAILGGILGVSFVGVLLWTVLYLAVPNVQDNTDKIFKWNDYAVEDTVEDEKSEDKTETETPEEETETETEEETEQLQVVLNANMSEVKIIA